MKFYLKNSWAPILNEEISFPYMQNLFAFLEKERSLGFDIYPKEADVFNAFAKTPFEKVKVVILGQDPYHGEGQAEGLSFSVKKGVKIPPSLQNIFKELKSDLDLSPPSSGSLEKWAEEGVFLLNTILTVRKGAPLAHKNKGWERFTDVIIQKLSAREDPLVFLLWGNAAIKKGIHLAPHHLILTAPHPSPLSAYQGFFGSEPFSKTNEFLIKNGKAPINWAL